MGHALVDPKFAKMAKKNLREELHKLDDVAVITGLTGDFKNWFLMQTYVVTSRAPMRRSPAQESALNHSKVMTQAEHGRTIVHTVGNCADNFAEAVRQHHATSPHVIFKEAFDTSTKASHQASLACIANMACWDDVGRPVSIVFTGRRLPSGAYIQTCHEVALIRGYAECFPFSVSNGVVKNDVYSIPLIGEPSSAVENIWDALHPQRRLAILAKFIPRTGKAFTIWMNRSS